MSTPNDTITLDVATGEVVSIPGYTVDISVLESPELDKFMPAYITAKKAFGPVLKETSNPAFRSKYEDLNTLLTAVEAPLLEQGLVVMHQTAPGHGGKHVVLTRIIHVSGQWMGSLWELTPTKADPQGEGSAFTYARRYQIKGLLSVAAEDDDGNAASQPRSARPARPAAAAPPVRDWLAEAEALSTGEAPGETRRLELLKLMELCERGNQMTPALNRKFIDLGKTIKAQIEAQVLKEAHA